MAFTPTEEALLKQLAAQNASLLNLASAETTIISKLGATKVTLSDLDTVTTPADADLMLARQGTDDKSVALSLLKAYAQDGAVLTTGDQTVAGVKTFSSSPIVPTADATGEAVHFGQFLAALAESGYQKLPSGLIIQWGKVSMVVPDAQYAHITSTATFPIAFPTALSHVYVSPTNVVEYTESWEVTAGVIHNSLTHVTIASMRIYGGSGSFSTDFDYLAIGY